MSAFGLRASLLYALRKMRRSPGLTLGVTLSFAFGIGANATMFGILDRLLLSPPAHVVDAGRVRRIMVSRLVPATSLRQTVDVLSYPDYEDFTNARALASVAAINQGWTLTVGRGLEARRRPAALVTGNFFSLLGTHAALGRLLTSDDDRPGAAPVAVIGYGVWKTEFGGGPHALGASIDFGYGPYTIIGVAPKAFTGVDLKPVDVWLPLRTAASQMMGALWPNSRNLNWLRVVARLAPGVTPHAVEAEATVLHLRGRATQVGAGEYDRTAQIIAAPLIAARGPLASNESRVTAWLTGISLLVLLIACANVANLLLARAVQQRRETAIQLALGNSHGRIIAQALLESLCLAAIGGVAGLLLARWGGDLVRYALLPQLDWASLMGGGPSSLRVLMYALVLVLLAGLASGLVPAVQALRPDVIQTLRAASRTTTGFASRTRDALTILQSALSVVLLVVAGLFLRSLHRVNSIDLGLDPDGVVLVTAVFDRGTEDRSVTDVMHRATERIKALPDVKYASVDVSLPFINNMSTSLRAPGLDSIPKLPEGDPVMHAVDPDYFAVLHLDILRGRPFTSQDDHAGAPRVVMVNVTMARILWPGTDALGRCLFINEEADVELKKESPCATVVGIVKNARSVALIEGESMQYYFPAGQQIVDQSPNGVLVRVRAGAKNVIPAIRRAFLDADPAVRFVQAQALLDVISPATRPWRLGATVFTAFGCLALVLSGIGLYGLLAFSVAQRTAELGVRAALGASEGRLIGIVVGHALRIVGIGIAIGLAVVIAAAARLRPLLYGVSSVDPPTLAIVLLILFSVAAFAAVVPARRATLVEPFVALRAE